MTSEMVKRVVARFIQAGQIGDLNDLLLKYRESVARFGRHETSARSIAKTYDLGSVDR
jgi:hypothetical protein